MRTNLLLPLLSSALLICASGCLNVEAELVDQPANEDAAPANQRIALITALDDQAINLVNGLNKVIVEGKFLQNLALVNPPKPIPMNDGNEIEKAIQYLLSNQIKSGLSYIYTPDSKFCSEVVAKNDPAACIQVMSLVTLVQVPNDDASGTLFINIDNAQPFQLYYSSDEIIARGSIAEIVKALSKIDPILKQSGNVGVGQLPTTYTGAFEFKVGSFMTISHVRFNITTPIDVRGENVNGSTYSVQISSAEEVLKISLDSLSGIGSASANLPAVAASLKVHDGQEILHDVQVVFPGLSGKVKLDNSLERMTFQTIKFNSTDTFISVDGQTAAHIYSASQIDAHVQTFSGGDKSLHFFGAFEIQFDIFSNALIEGNGQILASIAEKTELSFKFNSVQAQVISGSLQLTGAGDFAGSLNAQAGSCIEGLENAFPLQQVVCQ